jgi:hypothetical protein
VSQQFGSLVQREATEGPVNRAYRQAIQIVRAGILVGWRVTRRPSIAASRALLELATIIAGVLIALAACDWRDSVRDRTEGATYHARLEIAPGSDLREYTEAAASDFRDGALDRICAARAGTTGSQLR